MKRFLFCIVAFLLLAGHLLAQAKPGQVIANIPAENGTISVINADNKLVNLKIGEANFPLDAEEALRLANWIKEGQSNSYSGQGPVAMKREKDAFILATPGKEATELRLKKEWAYQLAQALASGRMNVSEASRP